MKKRESDRQQSRIRVDAENSTIHVFIGTLALDEASELILSAWEQACGLLDERASLRRFRPPYTLTFLDDNETPFLTSRGFRGEPLGTGSSVVAEDVRGRRARVRVEVTDSFPQPPEK
jgi:hypothetical protein